MPFATDDLVVTIRPDGLCSFDQCDRRMVANQLCETHRKQAYRGQALVPITSNLPPAGTEIPEGHCWCKQCKNVLPMSAYSGHHTKPNRRVSVCKNCLHGDQPPRPKKARPAALVVPVGHKWCASCETVKPLDDFRQKSNYCKPCHLDSNRRALYGMAKGDYERMYAEQDGRCAICRRKCRRGGETLCVDHDHKTGAIRGLLCNDCNRSLGGFGDDPERLRSAANYVEGRS